MNKWNEDLVAKYFVIAGDGPVKGRVVMVESGPGAEVAVVGKEVTVRMLGSDIKLTLDADCLERKATRQEVDEALGVVPL